MKNKLLMTTALIGSVAFAGSSFAETKVIGDVEATFKSTSRDLAANENEGVSGFGTEENIGVVTTKDLDNGMTMKAGMKLEDGVSDSQYIEVSSGNFSVHVGADYGNNANGILIPTVGDHYKDAGLASLASTNKLTEEAHDALHLGLAAKFDGGVVYMNYAPSSDKSAGDSAVTDAGGSITEVGLNASVEGVSIKLGATDAKQAVAGGATGDMEERSYAIGYTFGQFSVGAHKRTYYDGGTSAATNDFENTSYGVTYAVNDGLSLGLQYGEASEGDDTVDEETTAFSVGYSLGGMGFEITYSQTDNIGAVSGDDGEAIQVRTVAKF